MTQCKFTCPHPDCNFEHIVGEAARGRHMQCARCKRPLIVNRSGIGCTIPPELPLLKVNCGQCGHEHVVADEALGKPFRCSCCGEEVSVEATERKKWGEPPTVYTWEKDLNALGGGILPDVTDEDLRQFVAHVHAIMLACKGHPKHGKILRRVLRELLVDDPAAG